MDDGKVTKALMVRANMYLTAKQLAIFARKHEDNMPQKDIAEEFGVSESSVSRTLKRAMIRIETSWRKK